MSGRVLVTGGAGFIGSHIAEAYLKEGWEVVALDDLSRGHEQNVPKAARFVRADIRSPEATRTEDIADKAFLCGLAALLVAVLIVAFNPPH